jgi:ribosomal protein S18 acetylase RimI-like enzyme
MHVEDTGDLLLVDSGLPCDTFNKILAARLGEETADARIAAAVAYFRRRGLPFSWWVGPESLPADLGARLERHGLLAAETELGMAARVAAIPPPPQPAGLETRRAMTELAIREFAVVNAANWDPPDQNVLEFFTRASTLLLHPACPMQLFVGYSGGVPAATGELFLGGGVGGIHMISVSREFRRRGFGAAITWAAIEAAKLAGVQWVTLQASEEGRPVYERLGFTSCGQYTEYQ